MILHIAGMLLRLHNIKIISTILCKSMFIQNSLFNLNSLPDGMFHLSVRHGWVCTYNYNGIFILLRLLWYLLQRCTNIISFHHMRFLLFDCHLDWIWNQLSHPPLGVSVRGFLQSINWEGCPFLQICSHLPAAKK